MRLKLSLAHGPWTLVPGSGVGHCLGAYEVVYEARETLARGPAAAACSLRRTPTHPLRTPHPSTEGQHWIFLSCPTLFPHFAFSHSPGWPDFGGFWRPVSVPTLSRFGCSLIVV